MSVFTGEWLVGELCRTCLARRPPLSPRPGGWRDGWRSSRGPAAGSGRPPPRPRRRLALTSCSPPGTVNIASLSGGYATEKFPGLAAYNVSKYGVIGLTEAIAVEGKEHGISAICLSPGAVDTEMLRRANPALCPGLTADDVAELIVALLDSRLTPASGANIPLFSNA